MSSDYHLFIERLILELIIGSVPYILLFILIITRVCQILHLPSSPQAELVVSIRIKIILTLCLSVTLVLIPIFAYVLEESWFSKTRKSYSLIFLAQGFVLILQVILMGYEFRKQVPTPWYINLLFWALISLLYLIFLMNSLLFLDFKDNSYLIIDVLRFFFGCMLLIYGIYKKQDIDSFKHQPHFFTKPLLASRKYSLIENIEKKNFLLPATLPEPCNIPIKLSVKHKKSSEGYYEIKITLPDISYTISHTIGQILEIEAQIKAENQFRRLDNKITIEIDKSSENTVKIADSIEHFLRFFLENDVLITPKIVTFLQIPNPYKRKLLKKIAENRKNDDFIANVNNSVSSQASKSQLQDESDVGLFTEPPEKHFCVFFMIEYIEFKKIDEHYEFSFLITSKSSSDPKKWIISRRYKDFLRLEENMKRNLKNLPKLPGKNLFHNEENLHERSLKLEKYLRILLNETIYIKNEDFLAFIEFPKDFGDWDTPDFPNIHDCYRYYTAKFFETKISFENNETQFVLYIITIEEKDKFKCRIAKRYTDFEKLHEALIIRFGKELIPELPGKLDFLAGSQIKSRGERLLEYLNSLFGTNGVEDCFTLRKFVGMEVKSLVN